MILASCSSRKESSTTGWEYNNAKNGGYETNERFIEQATGPGLMFVEGGSFTMGRVEQDVMYEWDNIPRRQTVSSFYMDETEVRNVDYLEYLFWVNRVYGQSYPEVYKKTLPDTLVWRDKLGYNEPFVKQYLRHPAYKNYPVVGVSWQQATDYCAWRTDRVNERILIIMVFYKKIWSKWMIMYSQHNLTYKDNTKEWLEETQEILLMRIMGVERKVESSKWKMVYYYLLTDYLLKLNGNLLH